MKRIETSITLANLGMHSPARYRTAKKMIQECRYKKTRLYHFVLTPPKDSLPLTVDHYRKAAEGIARLLRDNNMPCCGKGAFEVSEDRGGLHFHFMVLVEAAYGRVDYWLSAAEDGPLKTMLKGFGVKVHIAPPENKMHLTADGKMPLYAYVTKKGPKLEDALVRVSYLYKKRSKDDSMTRVYYSTREKAKKAEVQQAEAKQDEAAQEAPAPATTQPTTTNNEQEGAEDTMTINDLPATAHTYIASLYESYVDKGLDLAQIRTELAKSGIKRTLGQVVHDLDSRYSFTGYAASHPAPRRLTFAEIDALEEVKASRPARVLIRSKDSSKLVGMHCLN